MVLPSPDTLLPRLPSFAELCPELAAEWDTDANGALEPGSVGPYSRRHVTWACRDCAHRWVAPVMDRTLTGNACPACAQRLPLSATSLAAARPELLDEWHPERNTPYTPEKVSARSNRQAWWRCGQGHEWRAKVTHRTQGLGGCPECAEAVVEADAA